tara:strand:- start:599 stop:1042 length:444 start_codon:yes stop_codon:yes gene_type:complete
LSPTLHNSYSKKSIKWLEKFAQDFGAPIKHFPFQSFLYCQQKKYTSNLTKNGYEISKWFLQNKYSAGAIILFGPERYDSLVATAAALMIPIIYIFPPLEKEEFIIKEIKNLPAYPYFTPFVNIYFTNIVNALSSALPTLCLKEKNLE